MNTEVDNSLDNEILIMKFRVAEVNGLLNAMNDPVTPVIIKAGYMDAIQRQCGPQIQQLKANQEEKNGTKEAPKE